MVNFLINLKKYKFFRFFIYFVIAIFFILISLLAVKNLHTVLYFYNIGNDFVAYYSSGIISRTNVQDLYYLTTQFSVQKNISPTEFLNFFPYLNPPFISYLIIPLTFISFHQAIYLWLFMNILILGLFLIGIFIYYKSYDWWIRIFIIISILFFNPVHVNIFSSQLSLIIALIILFAWFLYSKNKYVLSGFLLSLLIIKLQFIILPILVLLINKNKKWIIGLIIGVISLLLISFVPMGLPSLKTYIQYLISYGNGLDNLIFNVNVYSVIYTIFGFNNIFSQIIYFSFVIFISILVIYIWYFNFSKNSYANNMRWAALLISILLISPHTHPQDYILVLISIIILIPKNYIDFNKIPKTIKFFIFTVFPTTLFLSGFELKFKILFVIYFTIFTLFLIIETIKLKEGLNFSAAKK